jgi:hypothetical protein
MLGKIIRKITDFPCPQINMIKIKMIFLFFKKKQTTRLFPIHCKKILINRNFIFNRSLSCVDPIPWPAMSPDMNPIEHVWDFIGRKMIISDPIFGRRGEVHVCFWN